MTIAEWRADGARTAEWLKLLNTDLVREALQVLKDQGLHSGLGEYDLTAHALSNAKRDGYFSFYQNLLALGLFENNKKKALPREWEYKAPTKKATTEGDTK